jgi:processive 1,2-diacylglycerol beta-glucosyltransferase
MRMNGSGGVLVVSASTGTGHARAADALVEGFARSAPDLHVRHEDLLLLAPRWVRAVYGGGYELMAMRAPWLWREVYRWTDASDGDRARWGAAAERILFREFRRLLLSRHWDACVCTHFLPGQLTAGRPGLPPFSTVVTDFTLHRFWVQPRVRSYFLPIEAAAEDLRRRLPGVRAEATGIPVAAAFRDRIDRAGARHLLGLAADAPIVLVMGGGLGIGVEAATHALLASGVSGLQVISLCGRNDSARGALATLGLPDDRLRVIGFEPAVHRLIAACDVVVTKPGGLTCSETLAMGRPLILTRPIPGQEEGNTRALVGAGVALAAPSDAALAHAIQRFYGEPGLWLRLQESARRIGSGDAADRIAAATLTRPTATATAA